MGEQLKKYAGWSVLRSFFPLVLLFSHLRSNLISVLYWAFLFSLVMDDQGGKFGISFLFLSPEYLGSVSSWSFFLIGFSLGGFTMAFNSYSYLRLASRFPFLAMVHKPFVRFCINNSLIPILFNVVYIVHMVRFQRSEEYATVGELLKYVCMYGFGYFLFLGISFLWFFPLSRNFFDLLKPRKQEDPQPKWVRVTKGKTMNDHDATERRYWYIGKSMRVMQARPTRHYSKVFIQKVFSQNRISTTIFECVSILSFIILGLLTGVKWLDLPAAASIVLLLTVILMVFSSLLSWLKSWTYVFILLAVLGMNYVSKRANVFRFESQAIGLNYHKKNDPYNTVTIAEICGDKAARKTDSLRFIALLNNWKKNTGEAKPHMILLNVSGGGSRSASWTFEVMRYLDSLTGRNFTSHTALITGASGGMVGAAYYRALIAKYSITDLDDTKYFGAITSDLLNKLSFTATTNDIFLRYRSRKDLGKSYIYDRGVAFEEDLNENTSYELNKRLSDFRQLESEGKIPVMIFSPMIVNDGRRLLISSQSLSFMTGRKTTIHGLKSSYENLDIHALLKHNQVDSLKLTSVLRMSATFPYVLPMVSLPTTPAIEVMDAGTRDNFGVKSMEEFLYAMRDWVKENTSGITVVQIRDTRKLLGGQEPEQIGFLQKLTQPVFNLYTNFPRTQDFDQEELLREIGLNAGVPMSYISFNLREFTKDRISLSWHLTTSEKVRIKRALDSEGNKASLKIFLKIPGIKLPF